MDEQFSGAVPQPVVAQTVTSAAVPEYAGFWRRFAAMIIDGFILGILASIIGAIGGVGFIYSADTSPAATFIAGITALINIFYFSLFESSAKQATPGKMALGIVVTGTDGGKISFWRSLGRNLGKIISGLILMIGYLMAAFTQRKQALHDMMASCLVVKKQQ